MMLTERVIRDAQPSLDKAGKPATRTIWDTVVPGLGLQVTRGRTKNFIIRYKVAGQKRQAILCRAGGISLRDIRKRAADELMGVRAGEQGPLERRLALGDLPSVGDLWERFSGELAVERIALQRMTTRTLAEYSKLAKRHLLPALGSLKVKAVTKMHIEQMAKGLTGTPATRNRLLALTSRLFTLAETWEWRDQNTNPAKGVARAREEARTRIFTPHELQRLNGVLMKLQPERPFEVGAILCGTMTGLRASEILSLRWEDVHLEEGRAVLRQSKTGKRVVPLARPVRDLLADLPRIHGNGYCFSSLYLRRGESAVTYKSMRRMFKAACQRANIEGATLHDLRRSYLTMLAGAGVGAFAIRDAAGHKSLQMANRYVQAGAALMQTAEHGAALVSTAMAGKIDKTAAPIQRKRTRHG